MSCKSIVIYLDQHGSSRVQALFLQPASRCCTFSALRAVARRPGLLAAAADPCSRLTAVLCLAQSLLSPAVTCWTRPPTQTQPPSPTAETQTPTLTRLPSPMAQAMQTPTPTLWLVTLYFLVYACVVLAGYDQTAVASSCLFPAVTCQLGLLCPMLYHRVGCESLPVVIKCADKWHLYTAAAHMSSSVRHFVRVLTCAWCCSEQRWKCQCRLPGNRYLRRQASISIPNMVAIP